MSAARRLVLPGLLTLVALVGLIGLGLWQLERMVWKEALIARLAAAERGEPAALAAVAARAPDDIELARVELTGRFVHAGEIHVWTPRPEGPGWRVVTPLLLPAPVLAADASAHDAALVIRGWVPQGLKALAARAGGQIDAPVTVTGRIRLAPPERWATAPSLAKNEWLSLDAPAMLAQARTLLPGRSFVPFLVEAATVSPTSDWPRAGLGPISLPNNHLGYALTWFGLAATLVGVFAAFAIREWRSTAAG